jgi:hypothetical protein
MGITINYKLGQEKQWVRSTIDAVRDAAIIMLDRSVISGIKPFEIHRPEPTKLHVTIGGCETLTFDFRPRKEWEEEHQKNGWNYQHSALTMDDIAKEDDDGMLWSAAFCKTQFAQNIIEHKFVADLIKIAASFCRVAVVFDEGDYYHSGKLEDATGAIEDNGKMIDSIAGKLKDTDFDVIQKGDTKIARRKPKDK